MKISFKRFRFLHLVQFGCILIVLYVIQFLLVGRSNIDGSRRGISELFDTKLDAKTADVTTMTVRTSRVSSKVTISGKYPLTIHTKYIINNRNICSGGTGLLFLILVHTAPAHFDRRRWMRATWANKKAYRDVTVRVAFLLGEPDNNATQTLIENESLVYGDVIQGTFKDSYRNLTLKAVLGMRWAAENCQHAHFVVKVDDDVFVNMFEVIGLFHEYGTKSRHFICQVRQDGTSPILRGNYKWAVDKNEFRNETHYPTYCNGYAVFMTSDVMAPLFRDAAITPFFWIDDVYIYGLLAREVGGFTWVDIGYKFTLDANVGLRSFKEPGINRHMVSAARNGDAIHQMWLSSLRKLPVTSRKYVNAVLLKAIDDAKLAENKTTRKTTRRVQTQTRINGTVKKT